MECTKQAALVRPPVGSTVGEKLYFQGQTDEEKKLPADAEIDLKQKNSVWQELAPHLRTDDKAQACFQGKPLITSKGVCTAPGFVNAVVK